MLPRLLDLRNVRAPTGPRANGPAKRKRIAEALSAEGIEVYSIPFENHNEDGGSIRCATNPLLRD
jgi:N-dimethylarginine dimethylaminohydrolase